MSYSFVDEFLVYSIIYHKSNSEDIRIKHLYKAYSTEENYKIKTGRTGSIHYSLV